MTVRNKASSIYELESDTYSEKTSKYAAATDDIATMIY